jgi:hypothetical protein
MTGVLSESSVPTTDAPTRIRIFLRKSPTLKIVNPLTIVFIAVPVLGEANDSWSAIRRVVLVLLFGAVVVSTSFSVLPAITAFAVNGAILILALNLLWTTL